MSDGPHWFAELAQDMVRAGDPTARFSALSGALGKLGFDQINYGFFDPAAASEAEAEVLFLSTMSEGWLRYYYDAQLHLNDPHVVKVREGNILPYRFGDPEIRRIEAAPVRDAARQIEDAGIRAALCIPLTSPFAPTRPIAGMTLGSSGEVDGDANASAAHLLALTHLFHALSLGALTRERLGAKALSVREKDCLRLLVDGLQQDQIAYRLKISRATVELHLRNARAKLRARSLPQAVARALMFGEIEP